MNKYTAIIIFLFIFAIPVFSSGEGTVETTDAGNVQIPITRVTLYTAGLAQMVRETTVTGDGVIAFQAEPRDINDILKSLIVEDLDGGTVGAVNFDSSDPLSVLLSDFRVNPSGSPALSDFLKSVQGEAVTVSTEKGVFNGRILSVESSLTGEKNITILNLVSSSGIQEVAIIGLKELRFEDPRLQKELVSALELIAGSRVKTVRTLKISCKGSGKRRIRLSYVKAVPLWKTSYRLVIDESGTARLEGWAIVQNTGTQGWDNIQLGFVAGQPNAFTMDLSTPRYITRKNVDIVSSVPVGPTSYAKAAAPELSGAKRMAYPEASSMAADIYEMESGRAYTPAPAAPQAAGIREGNFYRYDVKNPVSVDARSSGMIPIIVQEDAGKSIGVYDPSYNKVFKGIRLVNSTDAHWAAGPVTVLEGRYYGGDALLPDMIPGSNRILTYAVHGTLEVEKDVTSGQQRITSLKISDGVLYRTDKIYRETSYRINGEEDELVLIHQKEAGWKLVNYPVKPKESPGQYRFVLNSWKNPVLIGEEYTVSRQFSLNGLRYSDLAVYLEWNEISPEMKTVLKEAADLKREVETISSEISSLRNRQNTISRDQSRIRENMKVLDKDSDLFKRYSKHLASQENELEQIAAQVEHKQKELRSASDKLADYIRSIDL
ncbi:MAG: hypothetical protein DRP59_02365 [Spirochaetes bacterium]|nr:MAG: hypothetical protein DRP59_02365 [Spirochaetota bacterium]